LISAKRHLRLLQRDLKTLLKDLGHPLLLVGDGFPDTLPSGLLAKPRDERGFPVPTADLIWHFMVTLCEWKLLWLEASKLGLLSEKESSACERLMRHGEELMNRLSGNRFVETKLKEFLKREFASFAAEVLCDTQFDPVDLHDNLVQLAQERFTAKHWENSFPGVSSRAQELLQPQEDRLRQTIHQLRPSERTAVEADLRGRSRMLLAHFSDKSGLHFMNTEDHSNQLIREILGSLRAGDYETHIKQILESLFAAISQIGFSGLLEDISDGLLANGLLPARRGGSDSAACNIIPTPSQGAACCAKVLIALSRGDKGATGFSSILGKARTHLVRCRGTTKFVIFLCTTWDAAKFCGDYFEELQEIHSKDGVKFVFLLVGTPETSLARVPVALS
jgi:hypothetical protein